MLKRILMFVVLFIVLLISAFFSVLNSPKATAHILATIAKSRVGSGVIKKFEIEKQNFTYPDRLDFSNIDIELDLINQGVLKIHIDELKIYGLKTLIGSSSELPVSAKGITVKQKDIEIGRSSFLGQIRLANREMKNWHGLLEISQIEAYRYKVRNITTEPDGSTNDVTFRNFKADLYQGSLTGQVKISWQKELRYQTDLHFAGIDLNALKEVDESIHGQIEGVIQGSLVLGGNSVNFDTLGLKVQVTKNGRLKASLLKFILPYIPRTEDSDKLLEIIKVPGSKVSVEVARMDLRSIDEHKLSAEIKIGIKRLNVDINPSIDILYDGNLLSLIAWYQKLGK